MIGSRIVVGKRSKDDGEKPFWISFADLMSALMVLFLVVMSVALLAVTKTVTEAEEKDAARSIEIAALLQCVDDATKRHAGITVVRARNAIDFGDRARFNSGSSQLAPEQAATLRSFVPEVLRIARGECGKGWLKRILVEGFTDKTGDYLLNLNLSLQRSQRVLCVLFSPPLPGEIPLAADELEQIRRLFLVGGYSSNSAKPSLEESRRIELKLEFYTVNERPGANDDAGAASDESLARGYGSCRIYSMSPQNPLIDLSTKLASVTAAAATQFRAADLRAIEAKVRSLRDWVGQDVAVGMPSSDRTEDGLRAFVQNNGIDNFGQARVLCFGCLYSLGPKAYRLIADPDRFAILMQYVVGLTENGRAFRRCYRGLLKTYFSYDIGSATATKEGASNWQKLRLFLADNLGRIELPHANPGWVVALLEHRNLLTENPCRRYGAAALQGDYQEFMQLRENLDVSDETWLMRTLVKAQVQAAVALTDEEFKSCLPNLIDLLRGHALLLNPALGQILTRYAACADTSFNKQLCDFAVTHWKNPWLPSNAAQWQHYLEAKALVTRWLKRDLLRTFFAILADDGFANTRRLDFWELYCEDPDDMYFALGPAALMMGNENFRAFDQAAAGRTLSLYGGGADLHGFIMVFGEQHVVEFSQHGNRAYFYDTSQGNLPYDLSIAWVDVGAPSLGVGLKGGGEAPFANPMRHFDTKEMCWEGHFARRMGMTEFALAEFCRKWHCVMDDNRGIGGRLWVKPTTQTIWDEGGKLSRWAVLQGWGFRWVAEKNAAYLEA